MTLEEIKKLPTAEQRVDALLNFGFVSAEQSEEYDSNSEEAQVVADIKLINISTQEFLEMMKE